MHVERRAVVCQYRHVAQRFADGMGQWDLPNYLDLFNLLQRRFDLWRFFFDAGIHGRGTYFAGLHYWQSMGYFLGVAEFYSSYLDVLCTTSRLFAYAPRR